MKFNPIGNNILIKLKKDETEKRTAGGIVIPQNAAQNNNEAEVIAVGNGRLLENGTLISHPVKPGDKILIGNPYPSLSVELNGEKLFIVSSEDILGVFQ